MNKDIKAMNMANLQAYKEVKTESMYAQVPGWSDNTYKRRLFQKVPKRNDDWIKDRQYNQSLGMSAILNTCDNRQGGNSSYATQIRIDRPRLSRSVNLVSRYNKEPNNQNISLLKKKVNFGDVATSNILNN